MLYILFGTQDLMVNNRLDKLLKERLEIADDFNCIKFHGDQILIQDIVYEATLMPLGVVRKAIVVYNPPYLIKEKTKDRVKGEHDFKNLSEYIDNPNEDCDIIFVVNHATINKENAVIKKLIAKATNIELKDLEKHDWYGYAKDLFKRLEVEIDDRGLKEFLKRCKQDAYLMENEAKKLAAYTDKITYVDVETLVTLPLEDDVFIIFDSLIKYRIDRALKLYQDLLLKNEEPVRLISLLATQARTLLDVAVLKANGMSMYQAASELGIHEFRVKLAFEALQSITIAELKKILDDLYTLDYKIKSGQIDRFTGFELFLLNFR